MITCKCGRAFSSEKGFNAHKYYCDDYVNSLPEIEKAEILERKQSKQREKDRKKQAKLHAFLSQGKKCKLCGKPITRADNNVTYCSKSCAAKANYANFSDEYKAELQNKSILAHRRSNEKKKEEQALQFKNEMRRCEQCGKVMDVKYASGRFCSKECSDIYCANYGRLHRKEASIRTAALWRNPECRSKFIAGQQKAIDEGRWPAMMRSDEPSYPEKYWMRILDDAQIDYTYNYLVKHSDLGVEAKKRSWYKLDFYLHEYNLDLEIDGGQHIEQLEHDRLRDERLKNGGYLVYRIPWKGYRCVSDQFLMLQTYLSSLQ